MIDDNECGVIGEMSGKEKQNNRRKPATSAAFDPK
jgi:hypothetical protein